MKRRLCVLIFSLTPNAAWAAACCGGGFAAPSLITGNDRAQLTASASHAEVAADVGADQLWRRRDDGLALEELRLEGAHALDERWQLGGTLAALRRGNAADSRAGLGDVAVNIGYEYLTDWTYHPIQPKGLGFLRLTLPTGNSAWTNGDPLDARGRGFWTLGLGTLLTKYRGRFDGFLSFEAHYALPRFGRTPGAGGLAGFGGGWSWRAVRVGGAWIAGFESGVAKPERVVTASASVSYVFGERWATTVTISDQTLFGSPTNTSLSRTVMVWGQRRWPL